MHYSAETIVEHRRRPEVQSLLRPADVVMRPERLGAMRQSRLSFVRPLVERAVREQWQIGQTHIDVDAEGAGVGVYRIETPGGVCYQAAFFSENRFPRPTDRAYEVDWDILVWLFDGDVSAARIASAARENAKLVRGTGRADPAVLSWTRANRSSRLVEHTVERLSAGRQPDMERVSQVGYLARNIYYQANGMNGTRMFAAMEPDGPLSGVYQVQMLGLYMIREFSFDLVNQMARRRSSRAIDLDPAIKRYLGVGNATGVGLNYLVTNHPMLMARWIEQRELALACVKLEVPPPGSDQPRRLARLLDRYAAYLREDRIGNQACLAPKDRVLEDLAWVRALVSELSERGSVAGVVVERPWQAICERAEPQLHIESEEIFYSLLLETYPTLCSAIDAFSTASEAMDVAYDMPVGTLREVLRSAYGWAFEFDATTADAAYWNWYRSQDGDEPRMTPLADEHVSGRYNIALDMPALVQDLDRHLAAHDSSDPVAHFLLFHPQLRDLVQSVQSMLGHRYSFVRMNMKHRDFSPMPLTRFVLQALKGMEKTTLLSDRWVRGTFLQGAPTAEEISTGTASPDWVYPACPRVT